MKKYQQMPPESITNSDVLSGLGSRIFNLVGFNILIALILGSATTLFGIAIGASAAGSAFLAVMLGVLLVVVLVYAFVTLSLGSSIIIFEDSNPIDAIGRSFKLVAGKWWSTFGIIVIMGILSIIINQLFGLPRAVFFGIKAFTSFEEGGDLSSIVQMTSGEQGLNILFSVFETFGSIVTGSLVFIAIAFQFFNLVERKESRGLMSQIESIDEQPNEEDDEVY